MGGGLEVYVAVMTPPDCLRPTFRTWQGRCSLGASLPVIRMDVGRRQSGGVMTAT